VNRWYQAQLSNYTTEECGSTFNESDRLPAFVLLIQQIYG
jgi:hypothetical protein